MPRELNSRDNCSLGSRAMNSPLVTIVVPVYNAASFLHEALASIVAQTFPQREILVMDDASTDGSAAIAESFGEAVTLIRQDQNRGQFQNVQDGIARARGELIAVYHADDVYEPTIVAMEAAYLEAHPEVGAVFCMDRFMDPAGVIYGELTLPPEVRGGEPLRADTILNALLVHRNRFLRTPGAMVRRRVYEEVGPYREDVFGMAADLDMWLRIAARHPIAIIEEHLFSYRHTPTSEAHRALHLRTNPDLTFLVVDHHLANGAARWARPESLAMYEAYRHEDRILIAVNHYIRDEIPNMREVLGRVRVRELIKNRKVQRARLVILLTLLSLLSRLPRSRRVADAFYRRWHTNRWKSRSQKTGRVAAVKALIAGRATR